MIDSHLSQIRDDCLNDTYFHSTHKKQSQNRITVLFIEVATTVKEQ